MLGGQQLSSLFYFLNELNYEIYLHYEIYEHYENVLALYIYILQKNKNYWMIFIFPKLPNSIGRTPKHFIAFLNIISTLK